MCGHCVLSHTCPAFLIRTNPLLASTRERIGSPRVFVKKLIKNVECSGERGKESARERERERKRYVFLLEQPQVASRINVPLSSQVVVLNQVPRGEKSHNLLVNKLAQRGQRGIWKSKRKVVPHPKHTHTYTEKSNEKL